MADDQPPIRYFGNPGDQCVNCGRPFGAQHEDPDDCDHFVWPDSVEGASIALNRAAVDLWHELTAPIARLLAWLDRRFRG